MACEGALLLQWRWFRWC